VAKSVKQNICENEGNEEAVSLPVQSRKLTPVKPTNGVAYSLRELMVASAAREIRDGEVVFVGMRLPLIAFVVAKKTHAPDAIGLFENGVILSTPAPELIYTMADPPNIRGPLSASTC